MKHLREILTHIAKNQNGSPSTDADLRLESADVCQQCGCLHNTEQVALVRANRGSQGIPADIFCQGHRTTPLQEGRRRLANLPEGDRTFSNFRSVSQNVEAAREVSLQFANNASHALTPDRDRGITLLTLCGPNGTGKTHLLQAIGLNLLDNGIAVRYAYVPDLLETMRDSYRSYTESKTPEEIYDFYRSATVLLLDDITEHRATPFAIDLVTRLVDERCRNRRPLAVATNLTMASMSGTWGPRLTDRLFDRNHSNVLLTYLTGESQRTGKKWSPPLPPQETRR